MPTTVPWHPLNFETSADIFIKGLSRHRKVAMCYRIKITYGVNWWKTVRLAFQSRKRNKVEKKVFYKIVEHNRLSIKKYLVDTNAKNRTVETRICFFVISYNVMPRNFNGRLNDFLSATTRHHFAVQRYRLWSPNKKDRKSQGLCTYCFYNESWQYVDRVKVCRIYSTQHALGVRNSCSLQKRKERQASVSKTSIKETFFGGVVYSCSWSWNDFPKLSIVRLFYCMVNADATHGQPQDCTATFPCSLASYSSSYLNCCKTFKGDRLRD